MFVFSLTEIFKHLYPIFEYEWNKFSTYSISSSLYISILLKSIIVLIPKDFVDNNTLSIKRVDVIGLDGVTKRKQWSIFDAIMCVCFERLTDFRII